MSRPIKEMTPLREQVALGYTAGQLQRRPAMTPTGASASDYVLLQTNEIDEVGGRICNGQGVFVGYDDDPMEFGDVLPIDQTFLHLVLEGVFCLTDFAETSPDTFRLLLGSPPGEEEGLHSWASIDTQSGGGPNANESENAGQIETPAMVPKIDDVIPDGGDAWFHITVKFPFYSRADRVHAVLWQAVSLINNGEVAYASGGGIWPTDPENVAYPVTIGQMTLLPGSGGFAVGSMASLYGIRGGCLVVDNTPPPDATVTVTIDGDASAAVPMHASTLSSLAIGQFAIAETGYAARRFDDVLVGSTLGGSDYFSDDFGGATLIPPWDNDLGSPALDSGNLLIAADPGDSCFVNKNLTPSLPVYIRFQLRFDSTDEQHGDFAIINTDDVVAPNLTGIFGDGLLLSTVDGAWHLETGEGEDTFGSVSTETWVQVDIAIEAI